MRPASWNEFDTPVVEFDQKCPIDLQIGCQIDLKGHKVSHETVRQAYASIFEGFALQTPAPASIDRSPEGQILVFLN